MGICLEKLTLYTPAFVQVETVKGKGYEFAEKDPRAYHGVSRFDVEEALEALGELTGRLVRDDVTARIFARFCVGK